MPNFKSVCFLGFLVLPVLSFAQATNDYRSAATGPWTTLATWQRFQGAPTNQWLTPTLAQGTPTSGVNVITIQTGFIVNVPTGSTITIDQTTVAGTLQVDTGGGIIINNGTGTDLTVSTGSVNVSGTVTFNQGVVHSGHTAANTSFLSGSRYRHLFTGNANNIVPLATWNLNSTMEMAGYTGSPNFVAGGNWGQNFGNVEFNCTNLTGTVTANGLLTNIQRNLTITSTGTGTFRLVNGQTTTISVGGSFSVNGTSRCRLSNSGSLTLIVGESLSIANSATLFTANTSSSNITVASFSMTSSGLVNMAEQNGGETTLNVRGNYSLASGTITKSGNAGAVVNINFIGTNPTVQTYSVSGGSFVLGGPPARSYNFTVANNSIVDAGTSSFPGSGTFTLSGELRVGSVDANGAIQTGAVGGNVQTTGVRTFNSNSTIRYNGLAAQFIGNGHPTVASPNVHTIIDNASGVSLAAATPSVRVTGNLTMNNGILNINGKALTLDGNIIQNSMASTIAVNATTDITVNGSGALGTLPFPFAAGPQTFRNFTLNRITSGSVVFANDLTLVGAVTLTNGLMNFNGRALALNGTFSAAAGGALFSSDATSTLSIGGTGALGTLVFDPTGNQLHSLTMNRLTLGTATLNSTLNVNVIVDLLNGDFTNTSGLTLADGVNLTRASTSQLLTSRPVALGNYNVFYQGAAMNTGLELPAPLNTTALFDLTINGGSVALTQDLTINGYFTANSSTLNGSTFTITMNGDFWDLNGGSFTPATGLVIFNGNTSVTGTVDPSFNNIELTAIASLFFPATNVSVSGNFTNNGTVIDPAGTLNFNGGANQSITGSSITTLLDVNIVNTAGTVSLNSSADLYGILTLPLSTSNFDADGLGAGVLTVTSTSETQSGSIGSVATPTNFSGNVTVQRFMAAIGGDPFRYVASPIDNVAKPAGLGALHSYNNGWSTYSGNMTVGAGFASYTGAQATWSVTGPIHTGDYTWGGLPLGWNLIGNPYPSIIDWKVAGWTSTNISNWIAVTDNTIIGYPNYFQYFDNTVSGPVAMGQAFWVYVTTGTGTLTITETAKTTTNVGKFFRQGSVGNHSITDGALVVNLSNGSNTDQSFLRINEKAAGPKAQVQDFTKLFNKTMNVYFLDDKDKEMLVHTLNGLSSEIKIPMGVQVSEPGEYDLSFANINTVGRPLYLIDEYEGEVIPLADAQHYLVQIKDASAPINARFRLSSRPELDLSAEAAVEFYPNPVKDVLTLRHKGNAHLSLVDGQGRVIHTDDMKDVYTLDMSQFSKGLYLLRLTSTTGTQVYKLMKE